MTVGNLVGVKCINAFCPVFYTKKDLANARDGKVATITVKCVSKATRKR